jgi:long-chain acyl-CoA synthetase
MHEAGLHWVAGFFAILEAGLVAVPLTRVSPETVSFIAHHAGAHAGILRSEVDGVDVITPDDLFGPGSVGGSAALPGPDAASGPGGSGAPAHELAANAASEPTAAPIVPPAEPAVLAFTSGSTSRPRAVELTHANLLADIDALLRARPLTRSDVFLSVLPPAHLFELTAGLLTPLAAGARVVFAGAPLPNRIIEALRERGITHGLCVPALLDVIHDEVLGELVEGGWIEADRRGQSRAITARRLAGADADGLRRLTAGVRERLGTTLNTLIVGGSATDPVWAEILGPFGILIEVGYGLTEAGPVVSLAWAGDCPRGSVGRPLPGVEVRIGEGDEILVRGPNVMRGYFRDPEATAAALRGGWLRTGDMGYLDGDGHLFFTGRLKEAMVTGTGETLYPDEVEPYYASELFAEHCVVGCRDADGNDRPTLFVVPARADLEEGALAEEHGALRAAAPPRLRVEHLVRLDGPLPRTPTGKVRRRALREMGER